MNPTIDIPRRVHRLDLIIVVTVLVIVVTDLALIRDPLHALLGLLMLPAAYRVSRGFHSVRVFAGQPVRLVSGSLWGNDEHELTGHVVVSRKRAFGTGGVLTIHADGRHLATVGHTATPAELDSLEAALAG